MRHEVFEIRRLGLHSLQRLDDWLMSYAIRGIGIWARRDAAVLVSLVLEPAIGGREVQNTPLEYPKVAVTASHAADCATSPLSDDGAVCGMTMRASAIWDSPR